MEDPLRAGGRAPGLNLIETFAADAPAARIGRHLTRMQRSATALGWGFDEAVARALLAAHEGAALRLRLTLDAGGGFALAHAPLPPPATEWRVQVAAQRLNSADPWLRLKSTRRASHDSARAALPGGVDEAILLNERGEVCEGTFSTLFFDRGRGMCTPPLSSGLLPGILREEMIEGGAREEVLPATDLPDVRLWLGNSLRGLIPARLV